MCANTSIVGERERRAVSVPQLHAPYITQALLLQAETDKKDQSKLSLQILNLINLNTSLRDIRDIITV